MWGKGFRGHQKQIENQFATQNFLLDSHKLISVQLETSNPMNNETSTRNLEIPVWKLAK